MLSSDQINACLELAGAIFLVPTLIEAYNKKRIVGVHYITPIFFSLWGLWNIFYYPSLNQYWSASAACIMLSVNIIWLVMVFRYKEK